MNTCISSAGISSDSGTGLAMTTPPCRCRPHFARRIAASSSGPPSSIDGTDIGARKPLRREKNEGNSSEPTPTTGTPSVSSTSRVRPMSRIDFTPAQMTATSVRLSSVRSALTSMLDSAPW